MKLKIVLRIAISLVIVCLFAVFLNGCHSTNTYSIYDRALKDLTVYDYNTFKAHNGFRNIRIFSAREWHSLDIYNQEMPIERIQKIDSDSVCVVYKLKRNEKNFYMYVVFNRTDKKSETKSLLNDYFVWEKSAEFYAVSEILSSDDFSSLSVGDSAQKAIEIDYTIAIDRESTPFASSEGYVFVSYRLLSDGILVIKFQADINDYQGISPDFSDFAITEMDFYQYGSNCDITGVSIIKSEHSIISKDN